MTARVGNSNENNFCRLQNVKLARLEGHLELTVSVDST